jgi:hypothetical protein
LYGIFMHRSPHGGGGGTKGRIFRPLPKNSSLPAVRPEDRMPEVPAGPRFQAAGSRAVIPFSKPLCLITAI